ncbi:MULTISPECIES: GNAT family N-acetyltransferase [Tsukamurella]|uniref:GNAT family N-acetyltransferase n=2 Tax=Tsukamurella TaxID=2060 RepID=A0A5C5S7L7_9ACTN|nr:MULTISPECIES: GNAT family N-acetyltransferase [Tsukamurella]NMD58129.1 GNAT family N-acetyltransferase [Tsukamurella columbiensis]TWS30553.1 GNAT family N-acetyltransferase [Tsukamurella conjunctivitidis]
MPVPGDRVVVRRLLPSGRASDVIGTLLADGDELRVRADRDGAEHRIPRAEIVRWKAVPPRPVRTSEIRSLDLARARSWWSVEREWVDGWLCRAAPGLPGNRANAAAPLHPDASLDRLDGVRAWYAARNLPLRLTLSDRLLPGASALAPVVQPTEVLTAPAAAGADDDVRFAAAPDAAWLTLTGTAEPLVTSVDGTVLFATLAGPDGAPAAAGRLALAADATGTVWGGIGSMSVAPEHRRRGLASRLLGALRGRAADEGAQRVFLEVTAENTGAQALYLGLGFTRHHGYHYWAAPR